MKECEHDTCFIPDIGCALGHENLADCPIWRRQNRTAANADDTGGEILLPWSGSALGLADLGFVSGRARPLVIGVVGPQNAGKTTLLGAWYLLLGRGAVDLGGRRFAGSYSLSGWEAVAGAMRWTPGQPPRFPPHTTSRGGRAPGLLHLALRDADHGRPIDYLFTDAPGEWFQKWTMNTDSQEGVGARWVADRADAFLVIADCEALSDGTTMGSARGSLQLLAKRLGSERRGQPVALVWTKADIEVSAPIERAVRKAVFDAMPDCAEFRVSIVGEASDDNGTGLTELLRWAADVRRPMVDLPPPAAAYDDPLFTLGARQR